MGCANLLQVLQRLFDRDNITVLGVYVVEVRLVGLLVAVADGPARDYGAEAVLEGVDGRRADAS